MKRPTYSQLASDCHEAKCEASRLHCAMNDLVNDRVTWFKQGKQRVGISRADGPEGGIVFHRQIETIGNSYTVCHYWEAWYPSIVNHTPCADDKDAFDLRDCAFKAQEFINRAQHSSPSPALAGAKYSQGAGDNLSK